MKKSGIRTLLVTLVTLLSLASCITIDPTLGSSMVPANQNISIRTATLDLPVTLRMADSLQSNVSQSATVGAIRSETFGLFHADAAFSVTQAKDSVEWGANPSVQDAILYLILDTTLVVDPSQYHIPQNFYVHQLSIDLDSTLIYSNSIGAGDYNPVPVSDGGSLYLGGDTYEVPLKKEFVKKLFSIPMETRDSAELFMKAFRGLYLRCDDPEEGLNGGRLNSFDLSSSYMMLRWEYDDTDGNRKSTSTTFSLGAYYSVNCLTSGSGYLEQADPAQGLFMEGLCGIKPHIDAQQLRSTVTAWAASTGVPLENMLIAKATLTFPVEYNGDRNQYDYYSANLFPCKRVRGTSTVNYTPLDEINNTSMENGALDRSLLEYTSNISIYLQDLIRRTDITADNDLWMMPTVSYYNSYTSTTYYYADYYSYTQDVLNGTAAERHPVLKLTYAVLK